MSTKTYTGGCHCGAVRYSVELDLSTPKASKCNCSICLKTNRLSFPVPENETNFKLLSPSSMDEVAEYQFGTRSQHHHFCSKCGIHVFAYGTYVWEGKEVKNFSINAVTLDQEQGVDLRKFKIGYWDGKGEGWDKGGAEKPYDGGCY